MSSDSSSRCLKTASPACWCCCLSTTSLDGHSPSARAACELLCAPPRMLCTHRAGIQGMARCASARDALACSAAHLADGQLWMQDQYEPMMLSKHQKIIDRLAGPYRGLEADIETFLDSHPESQSERNMIEINTHLREDACTIDPLLHRLDTSHHIFAVAGDLIYLQRNLLTWVWQSVAYASSCHRALGDGPVSVHQLPSSSVLGWPSSECRSTTGPSTAPSSSGLFGAVIASSRRSSARIHSPTTDSVRVSSQQSPHRHLDRGPPARPHAHTPARAHTHMHHRLSSSIAHRHCDCAMCGLLRLTVKQ